LPHRKEKGKLSEGGGRGLEPGKRAGERVSKGKRGEKEREGRSQAKRMKSRDQRGLNGSRMRGRFRNAGKIDSVSRKGRTSSARGAGVYSIKDRRTDCSTNSRVRGNRTGMGTGISIIRQLEAAAGVGRPAFDRGGREKTGAHY